MVKNCYIHIPFCEKICSYCDFCKQYYHPDKVKEYLQDLKQEIEETYHQEELETIYIGGGTPTCLSAEELEILFEIIDSLSKKNSCEITIEGNFESITDEKLEQMKKHGINRISLGVESIHPMNAQFLERNTSKEEIQKKMKWMREKGFSNINLDLIYAIPKESLRVLQEDLDFITSLQPEHISTYSLMIEDHTKLKIRGEKPIEEELDKEMYEFIIQYLKKKEYNHYEISNFSKKGYESQHNLCYWKNREYYGFGCGAASYIGNIRQTNTKSLTRYQKRILLEKEELTEEDRKDYEIILGLRLTEGISLKEYKEKYNHTLRQDYSYQKLVEEGFLIEEKDSLKIPENLLYVSNEIMVKLLQSKN